MGTYADFLRRRLSVRGFASPTVTQIAKDFYDALYDNSHGSRRYVLSKLPLFGAVRRLEDTLRKWDDTYENTGTDPHYSTRYDSVGAGAISDLTAGAVKKRMARALSDMYPAEVEEDVTDYMRSQYSQNSDGSWIDRSWNNNHW